MATASATADLRSRTIRLDRDLPVRRIGGRSGLLWSRDGLTLAGIGRAAELPIDRPGGHAAAAAALAALAGRDGDDGATSASSVGDRDAASDAGPAPGPVAFAALPFDPDRPGSLLVPRVSIGADRAGRRWLTVVDADPDPEAELAAIERDAPTVGAGTGPTTAGGHTTPDPSHFSLRSPMAPEAWRDDVVGAARDRIADGHLDKAVLARELVLETDQPVDAAAVVERLHQAFPQAILFLVDGFVGASPELLVSRRGDVVRAHPLAGTAARSSDPAIDQRQMAELLGSSKDRWEHRITIDWLLDNLLPFCSYVDAEPEPSIVTLANVHHLGTLVEGRLSAPSAPVLELVAALHPTPAVGGSPQKDALALIAELEGTDRGRYAGPVGWVDAAGNGEFAVGIRSAELTDDGATFLAGVGVVADSDPASELAETRAKFRAMLGALIVP
ncbi:MAG: isochorismate synthase [Actinomycetota bacterium]